MVLESLIDPWSAKKSPWLLFFIGLLFSSVAVLFGIWIFKQQASLVMVFLTVIVSIPLMYATMEEEEEVDWKGSGELGLLEQHGRAIIFLTFLFLGFVVGYSLWYAFLPAGIAESVFNTQLETIRAINGNVFTVSGVASGSSIDSLVAIFSNNVKVLIFCVFFAFFFGAGAIFILSWNASVIAAAAGTYFRNALAGVAETIGLHNAYIYFHTFVEGILRYMTHGTFEIVAYFIGGLAGGIISIALVNHSPRSPEFKKVWYDSLVLFLIAVVFLAVGSLVEVYVTPAIFS